MLFRKASFSLFLKPGKEQSPNFIFFVSLQLLNTASVWGEKGKAKQEMESKSQKIKSAQIYFLFFVTVTHYGKIVKNEQQYAACVWYTQHPQPLLWLHKKGNAANYSSCLCDHFHIFFTLNYKKMQMGGIKFLHLLHLESAVTSLCAPPYAARILIRQCRPECASTQNSGIV